MGWSTTVIIPPDGDMQAYLRSLRKLLLRSDEVYWPTHGPAIRDPHAFVRASIAHREEREREILDCLAAGVSTIPEIVAQIYAAVDRRLHAAAGRSVLAHLILLVETRRAQCEGAPRLEARFGPAP